MSRAQGRALSVRRPRLSSAGGDGGSVSHQPSLTRRVGRGGGWPRGRLRFLMPQGYLLRLQGRCRARRETQVFCADSVQTDSWSSRTRCGRRKDEVSGLCGVGRLGDRRRLEIAHVEIEVAAGRHRGERAPDRGGVGSTSGALNQSARDSAPSCNAYSKPKIPKMMTSIMTSPGPRMSRRPRSTRILQPAHGASRSPRRRARR